MNRIKFTIGIVFIGFLLFGNLLPAQRNIPYVKHMKLGVERDKVLVSYDLANASPDSNYKVNLVFSDSRFRIIVPDSVTGDIGNRVNGGKGKQIVWDIRADQVKFKNDYRASLVINGIPDKGGKGGPKNALLSLAMPGLGDYFVSNFKQRKIKPWYITVSSWGLIGLGIYAGSQRYTDQIIDKWQEESRVWLPDVGWTDVWVEKQQARDGETHYKFFKADMEIFIGVGAAIWLADIAYVWSRGSQNKKLKHNDILQNVSMNTAVMYVPGGMKLRYVYNF
ncbi:MAG: hypothetical protein R2764_06190 [Bacteroidales bacterium]